MHIKSYIYICICICICMSMQQHTAIYSRQDTLTRRAGECTDLLGWNARLALAQGPGARDKVSLVTVPTCALPTKKHQKWCFRNRGSLKSSN